MTIRLGTRVSRGKINIPKQEGEGLFTEIWKEFWKSREWERKMKLEILEPINDLRSRQPLVWTAINWEHSSGVYMSFIFYFLSIFYFFFRTMYTGHGLQARTVKEIKPPAMGGTRWTGNLSRQLNWGYRSSVRTSEPAKDTAESCRRWVRRLRVRQGKAIEQCRMY